MKRRILSILLVIVLMFSIVNTAMVTPAEAVGPALGFVASTEGLAVIAWLLAALGITFASNGDMVKAANQFLKDNPVALEYLNLCKLPASVASGLPVWQPTQTDMNYVYKIMMKAKEYFSKDKNTVSVPVLGYYYYDNHKVFNYNNIVSLSAKDLFDMSPYAENDVITFVLNGVEYTYFPKNNFSTHTSLMFNESQECSPIRNDPLRVRVHMTQGDVRFGFYKTSGTYGNYINPYLVARVVDDSGVPSYYISVLTDSRFSKGSFPLDVERLTNDIKSLPYRRLIDFDWAEFQNALQKKINEMTGSLDIPFDQPVTDVVNGKTEVENEVEGKPYVPTLPAINWADIWDLLGIKDLIKTLQPVAPAAETDMNVPQLPTSITDKFPFCVPFDLIALVQALNAPPVAPKFTIPLKFPIINYSDNIVLDFSGSDWNKVGSVIRWGNTLIFLAGLILITRKVIQA